MAELTTTQTCPKCDGEKVVTKLLGGMMITKTCPECHGAGKVEVVKDHSHFNPTELRK
jgi:DnaJ-class molecular chaperone